MAFSRASYFVISQRPFPPWAPKHRSCSLFYSPFIFHKEKLQKGWAFFSNNIKQITNLSNAWASPLQWLWLRSPIPLFPGLKICSKNSPLLLSLLTHPVFVFSGFGTSKEAQERDARLHWFTTVQARKTHL